MYRQSQHAAKLIRELSNLTDRLAARDIIVASLQADYIIFGSWHLIIRKHHEEVRFTWDGRDAVLAVERSSCPDSHTQCKWKEGATKRFDPASGDDPLKYVEDYLTQEIPL